MKHLTRKHEDASPVDEWMMPGKQLSLFSPAILGRNDRRRTSLGTETTRVLRLGLPMFVLAGLVVALLIKNFSPFDTVPRVDPAPKYTKAAVVSPPFYYTFRTNGTLYEAGEMEESTSPFWWLNSGGLMPIFGGVGMTNQEALPRGSAWQKIYELDNPIDTDGGLHPQNIFRLLTRSKWQDVREEVYMQIIRDQLSASPNRNESNGILLFSRYLEGDDLYYAGIRVDGRAVIKKKSAGTYHTLAEVVLFPGNYDRASSANLLPHNEWIGLRLDTETRTTGVVRITLYVDAGRTGVWRKVVEATDDGTSGGKAFTEEGYSGIRTDFMDVHFSDFRISALSTHS